MANNWDIAGTGLKAFDNISTGINALSTSKINAKLQRRAGNEAFKTIIGDMHQAIGAYQAEQGASGVISNSATDVKNAAIGKGTKAAAMARYNANMSAVDLEAQGRAKMSQGLIGAGSEILKTWGTK